MIWGNRPLKISLKTNQSTYGGVPDVSPTPAPDFFRSDSFKRTSDARALRHSYSVPMENPKPTSLRASRAISNICSFQVSVQKNEVVEIVDSAENPTRNAGWSLVRRSNGQIGYVPRDTLEIMRPKETGADFGDFITSEALDSPISNGSFDHSASRKSTEVSKRKSSNLAAQNFQWIFVCCEAKCVSFLLLLILAINFRQSKVTKRRCARPFLPLVDTRFLCPKQYLQHFQLFVMFVFAVRRVDCTRLIQPKWEYPYMQWSGWHAIWDSLLVLGSHELAYEPLLRMTKVAGRTQTGSWPFLDRLTYKNKKCYAL